MLEILVASCVHLMKLLFKAFMSKTVTLVCVDALIMTFGMIIKHKNWLLLQSFALEGVHLVKFFNIFAAVVVVY